MFFSDLRWLGKVTSAQDVTLRFDTLEGLGNHFTSKHGQKKKRDEVALNPANQAQVDAVNERNARAREIARNRAPPEQQPAPQGQQPAPQP